jgi:hypothetical protein
MEGSVLSWTFSFQTTARIMRTPFEDLLKRPFDGGIRGIFQRNGEAGEKSRELNVKREPTPFQGIFTPRFASLYLFSAKGR